MKKHLICYALLCSIVVFHSCGSERSTEMSDSVLLLSNGLESNYKKELKPFYHNVASGDPTHEAVILWTRVTPEFHQKIEGKYEVAKDAEFSNIVKEGVFTTDSTQDYTVKIDVDGLEENQFYYYRFQALDAYSPIGRTKTTAKSTKSPVKMAFVSCSNYAWGYFNVYRMIAEDSLDVVVHLGDYIYEHDSETYNAGDKNREHLPSHELVNITDYRTRYAQYRLDEDLQAAHNRHPFITIWDDHEFANNTWKSGASNHQENEGDWMTRFEAARKAYYEWMPIREQKGNEHYRAFSFGKTVKLIMLDTRVEGRDEQIYDEDQFGKDTLRNIISDQQMQWLQSEMSHDYLWNVIGNQVMFSSLKVFFNGKNGELYADGWAAYPKQQMQLKQELSKFPNSVIVSGDFHSAFVETENFYDALNKKISNFTEFIVPSINSGNYDEDYGLDSAKIYSDYYRRSNPNLKFVDLIRHGYLKIECGENSKGERYAAGRFYFTETVKEKSNKTNTSQEFIAVLFPVGANWSYRFIENK